MKIFSYQHGKGKKRISFDYFTPLSEKVGNIDTRSYDVGLSNGSTFLGIVLTHCVWSELLITVLCPGLLNQVIN